MRFAKKLGLLFCLLFCFSTSYTYQVDRVIAFDNHDCSSCSENEESLLTCSIKERVVSSKEKISFWGENVRFDRVDAEKGSILSFNINNDNLNIILNLTKKRHLLSLYYFNDANENEKQINCFFVNIEGTAFYSCSNDSFIDSEITARYYLLNNNLISFSDFLKQMTSLQNDLSLNHNNMKGNRSLLYGHLKLKQSNGISLFCPNVKIELYTLDVLNTAYLYGTTYTNENGYFSFSINSNENLLLVIYTSTNKDSVKTNSGTTPYLYCVNASPSNYGYDNIIELDNTSYFSDMTFMKSFHILMGLYIAHTYGVYLNNGTEFNGVICRYPSSCPSLNQGSAHYESTCHEIHISEYLTSVNVFKYENMDVICHEYGHHIIETFGFNNSPGGFHYSRVPCYYCRYYDSTNNLNADGLSLTSLQLINNSKRLAFNEGYATFFGLMSHNYNSPIKHLMKYTDDFLYVYQNYAPSNIDTFDNITTPTSFPEFDSTIGSVMCNSRISSEATELTVSKILYALATDIGGVYTYLGLNDKVIFNYCKNNTVTRIEDLFDLIASTDLEKEKFGFYAGELNLVPCSVNSTHHFSSYSTMTMSFSYKTGQILEYGPCSFTFKIYDNGGSFVFSITKNLNPISQGKIYSVTFPLSDYVSYISQCSAGAYVMIKPVQKYSGETHFVSSLYRLK